ncbi:MAG: hypothetical protein GXY41_03535 [Phycisphaerae bacterium]|nr:hypothetical protein [Phycisphaerae bacterium]
MNETTLKKIKLLYNLPWLFNLFLVGFMMYNVIPRLENYFGWQCIPGLSSIRYTLRIYVPIGIGIAFLNWMLAYLFKCRPFIAGTMALSLLFTTGVIKLVLTGRLI